MAEHPVTGKVIIPRRQFLPFTLIEVTVTLDIQPLSTETLDWLTDQE